MKKQLKNNQNIALAKIISDLRLNEKQKIAFARILSDLIEADFFVEENEMLFFEDIQKSLGISEHMLVEAKKEVLSKAISLLKQMDAEQRRLIVECMKLLSLSDGTCVPLEAILVFAIEQALEHNACIYSVPAKDIGIDNMTVMYIENKMTIKATKTIEANFRSISNEFAMAGFDFVYIPFVVNDFRRINQEYLNKVVKYMIPSIAQEKVNTICHDLQNMTTAKFCMDLLYKKINIPLLDVKPSLLFKLNESAIINKYDTDDTEKINYANFLRIELTENLLPKIRGLIDSYHKMINCTITVNSMPKSQKFMYHGFHRSLFDLIIYGREQKEYSMVIDISKHPAQVYFEPVDGIGEQIPLRLSPQETSLYIMIAKESFEGKGLDWREETPDEDKQAKQKLLDEYNRIYSRVSGGKKTSAYKDPPLVHRLKRKIASTKRVSNIDLFIPSNIKESRYSYYRVKATQNNIIVKE